MQNKEKRRGEKRKKKERKEKGKKEKQGKKTPTGLYKNGHNWLHIYCFSGMEPCTLTQYMYHSALRC